MQSERTKHEQAGQSENGAEVFRGNSEDWRKACDTLPAGVCVFRCTPELPLIVANNFFYSILGFRSREEALQAGFCSVGFSITPRRKEELYARLAERFASEAPGEAEFELSDRRRDGKEVYLLARCRYRPHEGNIVVANVIDITERQTIRNELALREKDFRIAARLSHHYMFRYSLTDKSCTIESNAGESPYFAGTIPNLPEGPIKKDQIAPESAGNFRNICREMQQGRSTGHAIIIMRYSPARPWRCFDVEFSMVYDEQGRPRHAIIVMEDVTEARENEMAFKMHQLTVEALPPEKNSYFEFNLTNNVCGRFHGNRIPSSLKPEQIRWEDMIALMSEGRLHPDDLQRFMRFLNRLRLLAAYPNGCPDLCLEYRALDAAGKTHWMRAGLRVAVDNYTGDMKAHCLFQELDDAQGEMFQLRQDMRDMERELERSRIRIMLNQMQPHFLYNTLTSIRAIIKTNPDYASDLLYDFTVHLRCGIRALSSDAPIPFDEELKNVKAYMNIEKMRLGKRLKVIYDIRAVNFCVSPLTIQPLAENAVKHGIYPKGRAGGSVAIRAYETEDAWMVEVEDDGAGFNLDEVLKEKTESVGLRNLIYRLNAVMHARLDVINLDGKGTKAVVTLSKHREDNADEDNYR